MPNLKEINLWEGCFGWLKVAFVKQCEEEEKGEETGAIFRKHISHELLSRFLSRLVSRVAYMKARKYVNLIKIGSVVIEI